MARSSLAHSPTLVEGNEENQADEAMAERHFMPALARLPSVILAVLSYIVVMVTGLVLVYGASVQPLTRFMNASSATCEWGGCETVVVRVTPALSSQLSHKRKF